MPENVPLMCCMVCSKTCMNSPVPQTEGQVREVNGLVTMDWVSK